MMQIIEYKKMYISILLQIFYAEPRRGEAYGASEGSSEKFAPLLHPHMNIVYITIYYLAASEKKCFPYFEEYGMGILGWTQ